MLACRFTTYVAPSGRSDVQDAIDRYDDFSRQAFARAVAHLAVRSIDHWHDPQAKKLKGHDGMFEIRFKAGRAATRALGFFGPAPGSFTITLIATHKQNVYNPRSAFDIAARRFEQIKAGAAAAHPLQVDGEDFPPHDG